MGKLLAKKRSQPTAFDSGPRKTINLEEERKLKVSVWTLLVIFKYWLYKSYKKNTYLSTCEFGVVFGQQGWFYTVYLTPQKCRVKCDTLL